MSSPLPRWIPYAGPFVVFLAFLALKKFLPFGAEIEYPLRVLVVGVAILVWSRPVLDLSVSRPFQSALLGAAIFALWVLPDTLFPEWRGHWLFSNSLTGKAESTLPTDLRRDAVFLSFRLLGTAVVVPIIEELFWRGFALRWWVRRDFESLPLGSFDRSAFWIVAVLFALEHGPYWEVGLITGILLNYWITRTRRLGDCILAHAVANGLLAAWVIGRDAYQYWL